MERKETIRIEIISARGRRLKYSTPDKAHADEMVEELKNQQGIVLWTITLEIDRERTMPEKST